MPRTMHTNMRHVIVGCGGSGANIAIRLAELLAQDPQWRYEMDESIFFLLIDTDAGDLEKNTARLRAIVGHQTAGNEVYIRGLQTSSGFQAPFQIAQAFRDGVNEKPEGLRRFAEHWWVRNPDAQDFDSAGVFAMPGCQDVTTGAGQVPMVSYLAAWQAMRDNEYGTSIGRAIRHLIDRIGNVVAPIQTEDGNPFDRVNIFFLGSLAGGTGRGSVIPIAFKMKEVFYERFGVAPRISGYFLNEDCFQNSREPHEALPQKMNAMTGWSEVSAWIEQSVKVGAGGRKGYRYFLPGLTNIDDPAYDLLKATGQNDLRLAVPFDAVGVICSESGSITTNAEKIFPMLGAALYVRITQSHVESTISNEARRYFSVGSSIVEIPFDDLRRYFVNRARLDTAERMKSGISEGDLTKETDHLLACLGFGAGALEEFLAWQSAGQDPKSVMQRLVVQLSGVAKTRIDGLRTAMQSQDLEGARSALSKLTYASGSGLDELARQVGLTFAAALTAALPDSLPRSTGDLGPLASAAIIDRLIGSGDAWIDHADPSRGKASVLVHTKSAVAVSTVAAKFQDRLTALLGGNGGFSVEAVNAWRRRKGLDAAKELEEAKSRDGALGVLGIGVRFTPDEIVKVSLIAEAEFRCACARALGKALAGPGGLLESVKSRLSKLSKNSSLVTDFTNLVVSSSVASLKDMEKWERTLFADEEHLERSIPQADGDASYMLRRTIRPLKPNSARMLLECTDYIDVVRSVLANDDESNLTTAAGSAALNSRAKAALEKCRYFYASEPGGKSTRDILDAFELRGVLRDLASKWQAYLLKLYERDLDNYMNVAQVFRNFYGIQPERIEVGGKVQIVLQSGPDGERLGNAAGDDFMLLGMAVVAARTCRPFWRTLKDRGDAPRITVQVPVDVEDDKTQLWVDAIQRGANLPAAATGTQVVKLIGNHANFADEGFNRYLMVVYTSAGATTLDEVQTLSAWEKDPATHKCLQLAEDRVNLMPFNAEIGKIWENYRGSGFTDPVYVTRSELRESRWRPWYSEKEATSERKDQADFMIAVAYALIGPEWFLTQVGRTGEVQLGPIFALGKRGVVILRRSPAVFVDGYKNVGFKLPHKSPEGSSSMPPENEKVADNLDDLARVLDPSQDAGNESHRVLRQAILAEYRSYLEWVAEPAGFHPQAHPTQFGEVLDRLQGFVRTSRNTAHADSDRSAEAFWKTVGSSLDAMVAAHAAA